MARNKFDIDEELTSPFNMEHALRLLAYLKPYKAKIFITVVLMLISNIAALSGPYLIKIAIDEFIPQKNIPGLGLLSVIFLLTLIISGICLKFRIRLMSEVGHRVVENIRSDIFANLQKLPFAYYDSRPHGKILVRVVNYVNSLSDLLSNGIINLITDLFSLLVTVGYMLYIDVRLTLVSLAGLPPLVIAVFLVKDIQRKRMQALSMKQSNVNAYIHESICGMKVTQSFGRENENFRIFSELGSEYRKYWMSFVSSLFIMWPIIENISVLGAGFLYLVGISQLGKGVSVGVLIAFVSYIWRFWMPITNLGNFYNAIINAMAYLERIFETIDEKPLVDNLPGAVDMPAIQGYVEFRNVSFGYDEGEKILKGVSFKADKGDTIALVGPTGAGKTTIVSLISRFYDLDSGTILIDGEDISKVTLESLRSQMGIMMQDTFIFSGTIMDNIRYSRLDASDEEVIEAAKAVKAHDFISGLKDGYYTQVNERGSRLSTGQRQLISFARALLANPRILILDEATSSIDTKTELALQEGLERLLKGRTSFIIAHRLSTIKNATKIMYIDKGNIVEHGTHAELMRAKGAYYKLFSAQYSLLEAM
ncbi:MAG: ABC transporter ATP-binding protein/permease [Clostridia bacterium]|nr:ABC transporter ATP-binding protein/permease [Clostridia bacterium]